MGEREAKIRALSLVLSDIWEVNDTDGMTEYWLSPGSCGSKIEFFFVAKSSVRTYVSKINMCMSRRT